MNLRNFFAELKRRNVYEVAIAYAVVGWLVIQVTATIVPALRLPDGLTTAVVVLILVGFPVALVIAWAFEMTPKGMKRTENVSPDEVIPQWSKKKFAALIIGVAVIAAGLLTFQLLRSSRSTISATADAKSIAVLPFVNMSADKNDEYLSDGMTEELINVLSKMPGLRVPGRTSCFAFKGKNEEDIFRKVGDQLHVGTVLEGSVRKAGEKLRVTAQLINVSDGYHLWSKDYDGDVKDILNFQSNVAEQVVQALQVKLGGDETRALAKKPTENPEAHELYLKGRYFWNRRTGENLKKAAEYFQHAIEKDPNYALAYSGLADCHVLLPLYPELGSTPRDELPQAFAAARKAVELDDKLAEAHASLARALASNLQLSAAISEFNRAVELNPNYATAHQWFGECLQSQRHVDEALAELERARELDPLSLIINSLLGFALDAAGKGDEAIAQLRKT